MSTADLDPVANILAVTKSPVASTPVQYNHIWHQFAKNFKLYFKRVIVENVKLFLFFSSLVSGRNYEKSF